MRFVVPNNGVLIPDNATCVFHGQIYDVYQWPQKLFDGSTVTYEMLRRPDTMQILAIKDGKIVVIDEQQAGRPPFLRLPGGRAEPGESWLEAAKRECLEELGTQFASWRLVNVRQPIVKIEWFVATFVATEFTRQQPPQPEAGEHIKVLELTLAEWKQRLAHEDSPLADYAKLTFDAYDSLEQIVGLPEFRGKSTERL